MGSIAILFIVAGIVGIYLSNKEETIYEPSNRMTILRKEAEVYETYQVSDFVTITNGILLEDPIVDTSTLGKKNIAIVYEDEKGKKQQEMMTIEVKDHKKPLIWISDTYTIEQGTTIDFSDDILCGDNYDKNPNCYVEGTFDTSKIGEYALTFHAEDQSGNVEVFPFTLRVVENIETTTKDPIFLSDFIDQYKTNDTKIGMDVSKWQGTIDFKKAKENGIEFVMIRLGTQNGIGKDSSIDPYFKQNIEKAKNEDLPVGIYYYSYAKTKEDAKEQAEWVMEQLKDYNFTLPIAFDWECWHLFNQMDLSFYDLNEVANTFLNTITDAGYEGLLYGSKNYMEKIWTYQDYPLWLAHYTNQTTYQGEKRLWQVTNRGRVPGISGNVDLNVMYE